MILRNSIFKTRKLLKKTLERIKLLFSKEYQRLPKTSTSNYSYNHLENLYTQLTDQLDSIKDDAEKQIKNKPIITPSLKEQKELLLHHRSLTSVVHGSPPKNNNTDTAKGKKPHRREQNERKTSSSEKGTKEERRWVVAEELRELEKMGDVDQILDIEEVLYHYSRLNCPAYVEIVNRFFTEMCSDFFVSPSPSTHSSIKARSKQIFVKS